MSKMKFESSNDLDKRYEDFESRKETDKDTIPDPDIDSSATKLDCFICVVNKPLFFVLFALNVAFMLYAVSFSTLGTWAVYVGCMAEMVVTNLLLFHACYKYKLNRGTLRVHKVKAWQKACLFIAAIVLGVIVAVSLAVFEVNRLQNELGLDVPSGIVVNSDTDTDGTEDTGETEAGTAVDEHEIANQLAGIAEEQ